MRIIIFTQPDGLVIPRNIEMVSKIEGVQIISIFIVKSKNVLEKKAKSFILGFPIIQILKLMGMIGFNHFFDLLSRISPPYFLKNKIRSIASCSRFIEGKVIQITDPNTDDVINYIKNNSIDLVLSYSAPNVFGSRLLSAPKMGCINLHCSLLPNFAGILPSFWTLYKNETSTGATVHYMDSKIDNGKILGQVELQIDRNATLVEVVKSTKRLGGLLVCDVIKKLMSGDIESFDNDSKNGSYYSWPTIDDVRQFVRQGGRLI